MTHSSMRRNIFLLCFLSITLFVHSHVFGQAAAVNSSPSGQEKPQGQSQLLIDTIPAPSLAGNLFDDNTRQPLIIYLPPSYGSSSSRYPVVYFLPGFGDPVSLFVNGTYQGFQLQTVMDSLIRAGVVKEMIVVVVNGLNRLGGSFYANSPANGNWETYVAAGLITFIDSHYRTILSPGARAITGHSMGGFGAINVGMKHPDIFGYVYAMSPGLFDANGLATSPMFGSQKSIRDYLLIESSLKSLSRAEATARFNAVFDSLITARNWDMIFTFAYGAAFAARPGANAPHIAYPYSLQGDSLVLDSAIWKQWDKGFGDLTDKVAQYRGASDKLRALGIEYGEQDENGWIPDGCRYFSQLLTESKIPHQLIPFTGRHQDSLGVRLTRFMLPFCSENLLRERQKSSQTTSPSTKSSTKSTKSKRKK